MGKIIRLTESDIRRAILESVNEYGAVWGYDNGKTTLSVDSDPNVDNNTNHRLNIDTRVFGAKNDILDAKGKGKRKSLRDYRNSSQAALETFQNVLKWVKKGRRGKPKFSDGLDPHSKTSLEKQIATLSDAELIAHLEKTIDRITIDNEIYSNKLDRVSNSDENGPIMRYNTFTVPGTDVMCVTLFTMSDFNFSDAIKHGKLRGNTKTDDITGDTTNSWTREKIPLTYDGTTEPNIAQNFSLDDVQDGHEKRQYPNGGYTSINQFIDKSVAYGAAVLKELGYNPDFIVSAPSSSKFNDYFCTNLSRKLGTEYVNGFFKRNIVNVKLADGSDPESLKEKGFSDSEISTFISSVKNIAFNEINYLVCKPIQDFVKNNEEHFLTVPSQPGAVPKRGRMPNKLSIGNIIRVLCGMTYAMALKEVGKDKFIEYIAKYLSYKNGTNQNKALPIDKMYDNIMRFSGIGKSRKIHLQFLEAQRQFVENLRMYADNLAEGFTPRYIESQFKITKLEKRFRPYLKNVYVIADKAMTGESLKSRYNNAKFLIYDEDVNSGTTLRLVVDALHEKLPDGNNQILCLANAYSNSGR